ncbi:glycine cleavage system protein GcvH [Jeongeupia naejangsanensis]|uniref:Glycine cleavage system H protein n=1 Tax=Jeongeupia naejangsanensis TaxID=613195 RepID=A0ABS2BHJ0_9NEIS|nr:glycine cleavage system protein GcvH [Jeongeupia naejangsanensis]MBM3115067.1 glycine cleavage system protein GcvH [Jeongeupia naejangsanensis]
MTIPADLLYSETHQWARFDNDGLVTVGITHFAQSTLGDMVYVELPAIGRQVKQQEAVALVESVKSASDVHCPLSGEITETNAEAVDTPELINDAPYDTWLFRLRPSDLAERAALLDAAAYEKAIA